MYNLMPRKSLLAKGQVVCGEWGLLGEKLEKVMKGLGSTEEVNLNWMLKVVVPAEKEERSCLKI